MSPTNPSRLGDQSHKVWVKLTSRVLLELLNGPRQTHRPPVRSISSHRVDGVGYHDDTCANRDRVTRQPIRVTRTVEVLVMVTNHRLHVTTQARSCCDKLRASCYMRLHGHHLLRSQLPFLTKQRSELFIDLSNVMQQCGTLDTIEVSRRQSQLPRNGERIFRNRSEEHTSEFQSHSF